jgi:hypothetical protein
MPPADSVATGAVRGVIGAAAMNLIRVMTVGTGIVDRTPPAALTDHAVRGSPSPVVVQAVHLAFGAACGAAYALLPAPVRRLPLAGPAYGLAVWAGFELVAAPLLRFPHARRRPMLSRVAIAADHVAFGAIVGRR